MKKNAFVAILAVLLSGCAGTPVLEHSVYELAPGGAVIQMTDHRNYDQKQSVRPSLASTVKTVGDKSQPNPPVDVLSKYASQYGVAGEKYAIEIKNYVVINSFPATMRSSTAGFSPFQKDFLSLLPSSDGELSFIRSLNVPKDSDSIICVFNGSINGTEVSGSAVIRYDASKAAFFAPIPLTAPYKSAIEISIRDVTKLIFEEYQRKISG